MADTWPSNPRAHRALTPPSPKRKPARTERQAASPSFEREVCVGLGIRPLNTGVFGISYNPCALMISTMEAPMSNPGRRDFLKNSLALALVPATENSLRGAALPAEPAPPQQPRADFFPGFKREQIKTSGATINTVY